MEQESIDAIVTDPPYALEFMGRDWDKAIPGVEYWTEALRVAKPGAHLVAFGGTRTFHRLTCAIEDAGWEIRDCCMWLYGSGFPKSHNLDGDREGWGTALKPAYEIIVLARKPFPGTVADNVLKYGTGALNVDGCRVGFASKDDQQTVQDAKWYAVPNDVYGKYPDQHGRKILNGG
jgi:site-specific DNA-methyltransferase (adenine-specific)